VFRRASGLPQQDLPRSFAAMEIFAGHRALFRPLVSPAIALGNLDGVHRGHQALLASARAAAVRLGGDACVYTFDPHPIYVLSPENAPPLITTPERKLELLAEHGIDVAIIEPFNADIAQISAEDFFDQILVKILGARHLSVGYNFAYGHKRGGNVKTLTERARAHGIEVHVLEPVEVEGAPVSSSRIRNFISNGDLSRARLLLGRNFDVDGKVVRGAGRGRALGVPTANVSAVSKLLPPEGVYAVFVRVAGGAPLLGAASLGTNPTFGENPLSLEVHLLDFDGDLYGKPLRIEFVEHLRGQERFESERNLIEQMKRDIASARQVLAVHEKDHAHV
jgi:riboflavin kinase/FMN adenylyltransferase